MHASSQYESARARLPLVTLFHFDVCWCVIPRVASGVERPAGVSVCAAAVRSLAPFASSPLHLTPSANGPWPPHRALHSAREKSEGRKHATTDMRGAKQRAERQTAGRQAAHHCAHTISPGTMTACRTDAHTSEPTDGRERERWVKGTVAAAAAQTESPRQRRLLIQPKGAALIAAISFDSCCSNYDDTELTSA